MAETASETIAAEAPVAPEPKATGYSWYVLSVLVVVYILNFIDRQILSILAVDIKADLGLTDADLGFLGGAAFAVFYALFGIPLGRLADNWSRVKLLSIGLALWSTMTALSGFARDQITLTFARMGVGIGEATASPTAYSLISDYFPKKQRATALAVYSSGLYLGGGISLFIGAWIVKAWNDAYPGGGPLDLVGWQAAFLAVGIPGLIVALWVATLREPVRGAMDGVTSPSSPTPFRQFAQDLSTIVPPFTLIGAWQRGPTALAINIGFAIGIAAFAWWMIGLTGNFPQWSAVGLGYYAVFSWACTLRARDSATFRLIWGTPAFICTTLGYGMVSLAAYALAFWSAPYAETVLGLPKQELAFILGANGAVSGFIGVIVGGRIADALRAKNPAGRVLMIIFGVIAPIVPIWIGYTTENAALFYTMNFLAGMFGATALGAAAATTQDLVLPRMRGTATAAFFLGTTLVGLSFGPYMVGQISDLAGTIVDGQPVGDLRTGILSLIGVAPIALVLLLYAYRAVPAAEATIVERADSA
ncbi:MULTISPECIES: MFS transporter [unclassified Sphingopyxis]|jgi:MFS family permease|uniref:spinster family MFS transporter n=1 Tax=unclassified Sphingopyxis TaxID=2614943 RepID=UPI0028675F59|nr:MULTISPECIES: MFS transporter [unclassified Sphingopyxis]MDR6833564.1 MFS family permease [Sphingopyxis sp. BE122]MDR7225833.1 MFS family permease [Sphingopyxis sp. BE259]